MARGVFFGATELLVPAKSLVNSDTIFFRPCNSVTYCHILFDQHEIIFANGVKTESFLPGPASMSGFSGETQLEILSIFPELSATELSMCRAVRPILTRKEGVIFADPKRFHG